ncbi:hypothetical protein FRC03_001793 [Tulasnella sp. 419]|nr:hypothetical protein FRC03_001793 [Tulasnella sp. 419]
MDQFASGSAINTFTPPEPFPPEVWEMIAEMMSEDWNRNITYFLEYHSSLPSCNHPGHRTYGSHPLKHLALTSRFFYGLTAPLIQMRIKLTFDKKRKRSLHPSGHRLPDIDFLTRSSRPWCLSISGGRTDASILPILESAGNRTKEHDNNTEEKENPLQDKPIEKYRIKRLSLSNTTIDNNVKKFLQEAQFLEALHLNSVRSKDRRPFTPSELSGWKLEHLCHFADRDFEATVSRSMDIFIPLSFCPKLRYLSLDSVDAPKLFASHLQAFRNSKPTLLNLEELMLYGCFTQWGMAAERSLLDFLACCPGLQNIQFRGYDSPGSTDPLLQDALISDAIPRLKCLTGPPRLLNLLLRGRSVESITIHCSNASREEVVNVLRPFVENNAELQELGIITYDWVTNDVLELAGESTPNLRSLTLSCYKEPSRGLGAWFRHDFNRIIRKFPNIESFVILIPNNSHREFSMNLYMMLGCLTRTLLTNVSLRQLSIGNITYVITGNHWDTYPNLMPRKLNELIHGLM